MIKKTDIKLAEKELTVSSVEKIATTKTYTKSETHELTLESKDYRFKFDMNDVYNTLGMSSQTSGMQDILLNIIFGMQIEVNMYQQAMVLFLLAQHMKTMKTSCM